MQRVGHMTADEIYAKYPPFIREYIYREGWQELRDVQMRAAEVLFFTRDNLLLSSATASGKTEAAFFPILADLVTNPPQNPGVCVLYIAPLKSLINDQFSRMDVLLQDSGIPVTHWHGDASASQKAKLLKNPRGILQITPESLESLLIRRPNDIARLFGALSYVVLDEIHILIGSDRGSQILCQLARIDRAIARHPRRVGLSATVGDLSLAAAWLGAGSGRETQAPEPERKPIRWRLGLEHFYVGNPQADQTKGAAEGADLPHAALDAAYEYLYDSVKNKKALVFSNSREETEYATATLRQIAERRGDPDVFLIHHGNLSASLREEAEEKMKDESVLHCVTCATVTLELGIDIGHLESVAQIGAPTTVSGFLQRLGRSGRRGNPPEMMMVFREEQPLPNAPLPNLIPWELLRGIAVIELYARERFIEPPTVKRMPLSLAFHQTLSILAASGSLTPKQLAERIFALPPFARLDRETYRALLVSMVNGGDLELTDEGQLIVGLRGERLLAGYRFYAVFRDSEDYTVRCESNEIGTITNPPPVGDRFALAGRVWEVTELDTPRRLVYVTRVKGKMEVSWPGDSGEIHTRVLEKMREILFGDFAYPYLMPNAAQRLQTARRVAHATGMTERDLLSLGGNSWVLFPWLGTRSFRTLRRYLKVNAARFGLSDIRSEGCCYITFHGKGDLSRTLLPAIRTDLLASPPDPLDLVGESEQPIFDKYDDYIEADLLRSAYATDRLDVGEMTRRFTGERLASVFPTGETDG